MQYKLISDEKCNVFVPSTVRDVIFTNRNIDNILEFAAPTDKNLCDPSLLDNMKEGIELLLSHIKKESKMLIVVDSDVDGYTSAAILYNYLTHCYNNLDLQWMVHADKKHGIDLKVVDSIPDLKLVICPDSSSNEFDKHEYLKNKGIDTLVIDHHEAPQYSENATVINNQLSILYPNKWLSGAGMAFKFCQGLDKVENQNYAMNYIDLAALGIVADMMDVRPLENRYIINEGLNNINNKFFQTLIKRQSYSLGSQPLNSIGIMFYISPLINAVTRVGSLEERETVFSAFINGEEVVKSDKRGCEESSTETIAEKAARYALNCKNRQKKLVDELKEQIKETIDHEAAKNQPVLIIKLDEITNRNLTGLVANQLANEYKKPALLLIAQDDEHFLGSGRNYNYSEITNLKDSLKDTELFDFAEGHQSAFGARITEENIETFTERIQQIFPGIGATDDSYDVDFIFDADEFDVPVIREIAKLRSLWGKGFDEPLIGIINIPVSGNNLKIMGQKSKHLKFDYKNISYIKFHIDQEEIDQFMNKNLIINVVGRCDVNVWKDNFSYQVIIQNYEIISEEDEFAF